MDSEANRVCVDVEIINDEVPEGGPAENFTLTLSTNSSVVILNPPNATVVIHDDDGRWLISVASYSISFRLCN